MIGQCIKMEAVPNKANITLSRMQITNIINDAIFITKNLEIFLQNISTSMMKRNKISGICP